MQYGAVPRSKTIFLATASMLFLVRCGDDSGGHTPSLCEQLAEAYCDAFLETCKFNNPADRIDCCKKEFIANNACGPFEKGEMPGECIKALRSPLVDHICEMSRGNAAEYRLHLYLPASCMVGGLISRGLTWEAEPESERWVVRKTGEAPMPPRVTTGGTGSSKPPVAGSKTPTGGSPSASRPPSSGSGGQASKPSTGGAGAASRPASSGAGGQASQLPAGSVSCGKNTCTSSARYAGMAARPCCFESAAGICGTLVGTTGKCSRQPPADPACPSHTDADAELPADSKLPGCCTESGVCGVDATVFGAGCEVMNTDPPTPEKTCEARE